MRYSTVDDWTVFTGGGIRLSVLPLVASRTDRAGLIRVEHGREVPDRALGPVQEDALKQSVDLGARQGHAVDGRELDPYLHEPHVLVTGATEVLHRQHREFAGRAFGELGTRVADGRSELPRDDSRQPRQRPIPISGWRRRPGSPSPSKSASTARFAGRP
jgi:hypothetical protein